MFRSLPEQNEQYYLQNFTNQANIKERIESEIVNKPNKYKDRSAAFTSLLVCQIEDVHTVSTKKKVNIKLHEAHLMLLFSKADYR